MSSVHKWPSSIVTTQLPSPALTCKIHLAKQQTINQTNKQTDAYSTTEGTHSELDNMFCQFLGSFVETNFYSSYLIDLFLPVILD